MLNGLREWGKIIAKIPEKYPILVKLYVIFSWLSIFALIYSLIFIEDSRKIFIQFLWSYYVLWQFFILARSKTLPWKIYIRFFLAGVWLVAPLVVLFMTGIHRITGGEPHDLWSQAVVTPFIEESFKLLPLFFFLLLFQRAKTMSLADFALIGAATGAGFQFVEETLRRLANNGIFSEIFGYSSSLLSGGDVIHWELFTLFPGYFEENLFPVRMSVSHAVATALVALAIGSAVRLRSKTGSVSYSIPFFFFLWCFLDHSALNSFDKFDEWVYEIHDWIGNGYYTKPVFLLFLLIAIIYDYIKLNSIRTKLPLLEREYVIEPVREFFDLFFSLLGDRKRYKYLLVFYRDRRELGFRYLYGNPGDYTEIEKLKIRTAEFQKQLAVMLTLLLILSVSLSGAVVSMIQAVHDPACLACVFEDIGDWWNGLDTVDQLMIIGSLIALSLLFTGPWGAITFGLAAGDVLGMAGEFGTFLRNPRAWLAGLARMGPQEALAFGIEAGLSRIPEVRIGKKIGNKLEDYIYRLVRDSSGNILRGQSSTLATRLKQAGEPKPRPWYAAHHIVPGNESFNADAVAARRIFDRLMLDPSRTYTHLDDPINAAINGVWLPQRRGIGTEAYHPEIHTDVYYAELHRRLRAVTSKEELIDVLQEIKEELQQNIFPY